MSGFEENPFGEPTIDNPFAVSFTQKYNFYVRLNLNECQIPLCQILKLADDKRQIFRDILIDNPIGYY